MHHVQLLVSVRCLQALQADHFIAQLGFFQNHRVAGSGGLHVSRVGSLAINIFDLVDCSIEVAQLFDAARFVFKDLPAAGVVGLLGCVAADENLKSIRVAFVQFIATANRPALSLLKVARPPRCINVMQGNKALLYVRSGAHLRS